jgi:chaperone BCS1
MLQKGVSLTSTVLRRRMLVTLEINNRDRAYPWLLSWMSHQATASPGKTARWARSHELGVETAYEQRSNGSLDAKFMLVAGPGTHYFRYRGAWMRVKRERETKSMQPSVSGSSPWETVTLTALSRDRHLFPALLYEARDLALTGNEGKLVVFVPASLDWQQFGQPRMKRPLSSVVLAPGVSEMIEHDVRSFLDRKAWYSDRGTAHVTYLFCCTHANQVYRTVEAIFCMDLLDRGSRLSSRLWLERWVTISAFSTSPCEV